MRSNSMKGMLVHSRSRACALSDSIESESSSGSLFCRIFLARAGVCFVRKRLGGGSACARVIAAFSLAATLSAPTLAQTPGDSSKTKLPITAPLPPARPPNLGAVPSTANLPAVAPSVPTTPLTPPAPAPSAPALPRNLPAASRERMHACGLEWQEMKASGAATDRNWRDFAQVCLAR